MTDPADIVFDPRGPENYVVILHGEEIGSVRIALGARYKAKYASASHPFATVEESRPWFVYLVDGTDSWEPISE